MMLSCSARTDMGVMAVLVAAIVLTATEVRGQDPSVRPDTVATNDAWAELRRQFEPPDEWCDDYGDYRSPLLFGDGRRVRTAGEWRRRRAEILADWHKMMGHWPPVIERPQVDFLDAEQREGIAQHRVRFKILPGQDTEGYLLIPEGAMSRPAVLTVYYEPETAIGQGAPLRDFAWQLAKRGFVTLSIGNRPGLDDKTYSLYYPTVDNAEIQPLSTLAYGAANAFHVLASQREVDPRRVGIVGHSFGGKWAMFASCLYDKFACAAWSDPGIVFDESRPSVNYWEPWYLGYEPGTWRSRGLPTRENPTTGLYKRLAAEGRDLHELHALMPPRPFFVSGGSEDPPSRWQALNHAVEINRVLGYDRRVGMANREKHSPDEGSNEQIYLFFEHFLVRDVLADGD